MKRGKIALFWFRFPYPLPVILQTSNWKGDSSEMKKKFQGKKEKYREKNLSDPPKWLPALLLFSEI